MATQAYYNWVAAGKPFRRPPWLQELKSLASQYGVGFLGDLGNNAHLQANTPQDHTPFSFTEWPVAVSEYVINAIDLAKGQHAYRIIEAAKIGRAPWVKYVNVGGLQYNVKNNWVPVPNGDDHCHVSGRTDHTWTGLNGFNPFVEQTIPQIPKVEVKEDMNHVYAPGRGWALVGQSRWVPIDTQAHANTAAKVFGSAVVITAAEYDYIKSLIVPEPANGAT